MIATFRYEFLMQIRRPVLWIVYGLTLTALIAIQPTAYATLDLGGGQGDASNTAMVVSATFHMTLLPIVYGCLLADRLVRDRRLGVIGVLDTTPAGRTARLTGKCLGTCAATATPIALAYFGRAVAYAITEGEPSALGWATAVFVAAIVPGLLLTGALALAGPLLMPPMVFQVLFVVYWFWGNLVTPNVMPTVTHTILSPNSQYVAYGLLGYRVEWGVPDDLVMPEARVYGPWRGDPFNVLRPVATEATALLWIAVMIMLSVFVLSLVRLHAIRKES